MPYSNRPQYGQQPHYAPGDFEAAYGNSFAETIPPPPRQPSYSHRGSQPSGYPMQGQQQGHYPLPSTNRHAPVPPHSLAPVAMGSARGVMATGPQIMAANEPVARPSVKAGMSILFAGAIIGGLIGAVMHARQNAADAFSTAAPTHEVAADTTTGPTPPSSAPAPEKKDDANSRLTTKDTDKADGKKKKPTFVWHAPKTITTTTTNATVDTSDDTNPTPTPVATKGKGKAAKASNKDDDGYTIASADDNGGDTKSPTKPDVSKTKKGADKAAAPIAKDDAPAPAKKGSSKADNDAVSVLKAAMGATENSL